MDKLCSHTRFSLWHDPWHHLGPLITRFPLGPNVTGTHNIAPLHSMIVDGCWHWPTILDIGYVEITHDLPTIHGGQDSITWNAGIGQFTNDVAYELFQPRGAKVGWSSLLLGPLKIPRNTFVLWLAILGRLSTMYINHGCTPQTIIVLRRGGYVETHQHLFFDCQYSYLCLTIIRRWVWFAWPYQDWRQGSLGLLAMEGQTCGPCGIQDLIGLSSLSYLARTQSKTVFE
ncbi:UNVERIFIED_CONTAM: hypothetical protein Slati_0883500 [Sesamum latifolium]|uniref:Reverse transcriptase zinc-binding domain-containing protein n=1 Tax=Sesamum latifolium TaxID=2727402 RepID=A0AAW2XMT3_9LAMI